MTDALFNNFRRSQTTINETHERCSPQLVTLVDADEFAASFDVGVFSISGLQWWIES